MDATDDPPALDIARWFPTDAFAGQVAVVTGGGTGLGLEISRGLARLGARVVIASRSPENHTELLEQAQRENWDVRARQVDLREAPAVRNMADELVAEMGSIDILVNNAAGNFVCPAERLSTNAWRAVLGIVLDGTFYASKSFGKHMIRQGAGSILNVIATYAWTGMPGVVHSASAKAGVLAMTKTLAAEWAPHGIRVNAIAPGPFQSDGAKQNLWPSEEIENRIRTQIPLQRFAQRDEVAAQCLHLLSPMSSYVTGECIVVDGGLTLASGRMWEPADFARRKRAARVEGNQESPSDG
ncbi:MAG: NAD(P)-dependent dehydrogenase (short-subunit alcohol dehydrogenase family) [Chlamydiales bacterium]|jgi:NAD(P)-dependent dehydrogenase (short-subunit alcohol dehydrogenase family)